MRTKAVARPKLSKNPLVKLKDIADAAEVSIATVSLALRGHPSVSSRTRNLVLNTQRRLNDQSETLQPGENELCFLYCLAEFPLGETVYSPLLEGIIQASKEFGIRLELTSISNTELPMVGDGVDGVILTGNLTEAIVEHFLALEKKVVIAGNYHFKGVNTVETDSFYDGAMFAERVVNDGHRQVVFAQLFPENYFERQFLSGLRDGLLSRGVAFPDENILRIADPAALHSPTVDQLLALDPPVDAVVCISQQTAETYLGELLADERMERNSLPSLYALKLSAKSPASSRIEYYTIKMEAIGRHVVLRLRELVAGDSVCYARILRGGSW